MTNEEKIKKLPEWGIDFLIDLYLRTHNEEAVNIQKIRRTKEESA